jgi:NodT family efflux transporter outer membrane factor (OMF) lipoprotein
MISMPGFPKSGSSLRRAIAAGASVLALAACVPTLADSPDPVAASQLASNASFDAPSQAWPDTAWWRAYGDAQLNGLIEEGLADSPSLTIAAARLRQAEAALGQSRSTLLPSINGEASVGSARRSANAMGLPNDFTSLVDTSWNEEARIGASISYQLDFFGRNRAAIAAATSQVDVARAEQAAARLQLSAAIAQTYSEFVRFSAERSAAARIVQLRSNSEGLVRQRVAAGLEHDGQLAQARAETAAAVSTVAELDGAVLRTRHALAALLGKGPDRGLAVTAPETLSLHAFGLPADAGIALVGRRPDIAAARARVEAAARRIDVARADFYPDVNLVALAGLQTIGLDTLSSAGSRYGQIGPAISLPIFSAGRLESAYRGAHAQYNEAVALYDQTLIDALRDVADALSDQRSLQAQLTASREGVAAAEDAYRVARNRYEQGLSTYIDVLTIENRLVEQRLNLTRLESRAFTLDVALVRALGGGFQS